MKILIWKSYGEIVVYDISTPEKFELKLLDIISCLDGWGLDEDITTVKKYMEQTKYSLAFDWLRDAIDPSYDLDQFEHLEISALK